MKYIIKKKNGQKDFEDQSVNGIELILGCHLELLESIAQEHQQEDGGYGLNR